MEKLSLIHISRRFGKSLLISTLEAYYQGKKELFEGLAIEQLEKDWIKHPILHLDLNIEKYDTPESLDQILNDNLEHWESLYGTRPSEVSFSLRFAGIIPVSYTHLDVYKRQNLIRTRNDFAKSFLMFSYFT